MSDMHITTGKWSKLLRWGVGALLLFVGIFGLVFWFLSSQPQYATFESKSAGVTLQYDTRLKSDGINESDQKDKIVLRLQHADNKPEMLITLRYEEGLKPIATAAKRELRSALIDTVNKTYPKRFPDYHQLSSREFEIDDHKAFESIFTYKGSTNETVKQRFILIIINDNKAAYLAMQSKDADFDHVNSRYFDKITASLQLN